MAPLLERNVTVCASCPSSWMNIVKMLPLDLRSNRSGGIGEIGPAASKGWGLSAKLGKHSVIWGKLGTALQAYANT